MVDVPLGGYLFVGSARRSRSRIIVSCCRVVLLLHLSMKLSTLSVDVMILGYRIVVLRIDLHVQVVFHVTLATAVADSILMVAGCFFHMNRRRVLMATTTSATKTMLTIVT